MQRKTKPRIQGGSKERRVREQSRSSSRWTGPRRLDVSPNDKGSDVVRRIPSNVGCISRDECFEEVTRGGGMHNDKKSKVEKKETRARRGRNSGKVQPFRSATRTQ